MSEIEKMYENAGVEKEVIKGCYEYYSENGGIDIYTVNDCKNKDCNTCKADKSIKEYPPFTAEKQIELIKWLMNKSFSYSTVEDKDGIKYWFEIDYETSSHGFKNFEETIADTINEMWQDLTDAEKAQIKEILE